MKKKFNMRGKKDHNRTGGNRDFGGKQIRGLQTGQIAAANSRMVSVNETMRALVGFAIKSGQLVAGFEAVSRAVTRNKLEFVLINAHISPRSDRKMVNFLKEKKVPFFKTEPQYDWETLWKIDRWKIVGITRGNLGKSILQKINNGA